MSLYPVSYYNIGTGVSAGSFDTITATTIQTATIQDTGGTTALTLSAGQVTAINEILGIVTKAKQININNLDPTGTYYFPMTISASTGYKNLDITSSVSWDGTYLKAANMSVGYGSINFDDGAGNSTIMYYDQLQGFFICQPSPFLGAVLYWKPTGLLITTGSGGGFQMVDRVNTTNKWTLYSSGNTFNLDYNGSSILTATSAGVTATIITPIVNVGTNSVYSQLSILSGGTRLQIAGVGGVAGVTITGGLTTGTSYTSSTVTGLVLICNSATSTDVMKIFANDLTTEIFNINQTRITTTLPITSTGGFTGTASTASTITTTTASTGTYYPIFVNAGTGGTSKTVYTDTGLSYVASSDTLTVANTKNNTVQITDTVVTTNYFLLTADNSYLRFQYGVAPGSYSPTGISIYSTGLLITPNAEITTQLNIDDVTTPANQFQIYHNGGVLYFNNYWRSDLNIPLAVDGNGNGVTAYNLIAIPYNPPNYVELDTPSIKSSNNGGVLFENNSSGDYSGYVTNTTNVISIPVSGYNPNSRQLTFSTGLAVSRTMTIVSGATFTNHPSFNMASISVTATKNGASFTAFQTSLSIAAATVYSYTFSAISVWTIYQPLSQLTITFIPTDSSPNNNTDTYQFTISPVMSFSGFTGMTWGGTINFSYIATTLTSSYTRTSGTGTAVLFTPATPTTLTAVSLTKDVLATSGITTLHSDLLTAKYINQMPQYTFTAVTTTTLLNCFRGGFDNYEIQIRFTATPTAYSTLTLLLSSSTGTDIATGYAGQISTLAAFSSAGYTTSFTLANLTSNNQLTLTYRIFNPNLARSTTLTGTNLGSLNSTYQLVPQIVTGLHNSSTAYPSITLNCTSNMTGIVTIRGFN